MLDTITVKKIEDFVYSKPRSVSEIAEHLNKSWRTTDRYVEDIAKEYGTIAVRTFRGGTRGALKIAYWASVEKLHSSVFQEKLVKDIESSKKKEDFSAFDIFQHVPDKNKRAIVGNEKKNIKEWKVHLVKAEKQVLFLSGNLSWINLKGEEDLFSIVDGLVKKGVSIKILSRVDLASRNNIEKMLSLNFKHGKDLIEIRHSEQPIRGFVIDNKIMGLREIKEPTGKVNELSKRTFIEYIIRDKEWIEWMSRVFWKIFSNSILAQKRIEELRKLK